MLGSAKLQWLLAKLTGGCKSAGIGKTEDEMSKVTPFLWFEKEAEAAARFYVSLLPDSRVVGVTALPSDTPSGPAGSVKVIDFTLAGQSYVAMEAGRLDPFNHAVSFMIECETQGEIDRLWDAHLKNGGAEQQCGWLKDRWGLYWQITPRALMEMMRNADRAAAKRATDAMLKMVKLDLPALQRAFAG
jgi:predicted 3-demethylubiquinone-9 3-methyltransferase (glyoxalase superfamily)